MIYASETWTQVKDEFDTLGRRNFDECKIADGKREYSLDGDFFEAMSEAGRIHVTTARLDGELCGYVLTFLNQRHPEYQAFTSITIGIYMLPEYRKGWLALNMLQEDEVFLVKLGVELACRNVTVDSPAVPILEKMGWKQQEVCHFKWLGVSNG